MYFKSVEIISCPCIYTGNYDPSSLSEEIRKLHVITKPWHALFHEIISCDFSWNIAKYLRTMWPGGVLVSESFLLPVHFFTYSSCNVSGIFNIDVNAFFSIGNQLISYERFLILL